jgi:hypothetical protein
MKLQVEFRKSHDGPNNTVNGNIVLYGSVTDQGFLGELNDVHPDFAKHIIKAVNVYDALKEALEDQNRRDPLARALKDALNL